MRNDDVIIFFSFFLFLEGKEFYYLFFFGRVFSLFIGFTNLFSFI